MSSLIRGTPASPGRASGPVFVVEQRVIAAHASTDARLEQVLGAAERAAQRIEVLAAGGVAPEASAVLEAQAMMLRDVSLLSAIEAEMASGVSAIESVTRAAEQHAQMLDAVDDPYLRERAADIREVPRLVTAELMGSPASRLADLTTPAIVIAWELAPVDTLSVDRRLLLGLVTELGGPTSHAAIVARELGVPAVVGAAGVVAAARGYSAAIIDGAAGEVSFEENTSLVVEVTTKGPIRQDHLPVQLLGNAGSAEAVRAAVSKGALGIGLFRTEFLFLERDSAPARSEQIAAYEEACAAATPHPVVIRTLDAGSDKAIPYFLSVREPNPALGSRGIRLGLRHEEIMLTQISALVEVASRHSNLSVMIPMVGAPEEMVKTRALFKEEALRQRTHLPRLGMMVELPAVAERLEMFGGLVDFISLGTNDLTQYALGADRELSWEPELSEFNPGVLHLIARAIRSAGEMSLKAGVCGELAANPDGAVFLVGVGASSLSMGAGSLNDVADRLTGAGRDACRAAAENALLAKNAGDAVVALRAVHITPHR